MPETRETHAKAGQPPRVRARAALALSMAGLASLLAPPPASAQVCTLLAVAPAFGNYDASGPHNDISGNVSVTCTTLTRQDVPYNVQLGFSLQAVATQRRMVLGSTALNYNLYCGSDHLQVWGDGSGSTCRANRSFTGLLGTSTTNIPIYGRMPRAQFVPIGLYSDLIAVTITY